MGSYVNSSITSNEQIVYEAKVSWFSQLPLVILGVITLPIFVGFLFLLVAFIRIWTTELAITNKRIIAKFGLISRSTIELRLDKVETVRVEQSILGRILNYGSVVVSGAGAPQAPIPGIASPLNFRGRLNSIVEEQAAKV
ncbi:PH domain-containing protein [Cupriavidus gilardii]|uniref:PH domain-containing protein n=1 Tax=Cupriavidus gilardii TaxID=82541 RepID=UPI001ABD9E77|nr:PH domain-containing protein [Cupriavidus gilardii]MBO4119852.1 PH domain-containing protein [Cupriavidus gilardii]MCG5259756.1 PH domain-containing protein [Cupriavidus gilardii]MDF9429984.1 PH domain-containing protein [Cupriavidus gilardii]